MTIAVPIELKEEFVEAAVRNAPPEGGEGRLDAPVAGFFSAPAAISNCRDAAAGRSRRRPGQPVFFSLLQITSPLLLMANFPLALQLLLL